MTRRQSFATPVRSKGEACWGPCCCLIQLFYVLCSMFCCTPSNFLPSVKRYHVGLFFYFLDLKYVHILYRTAVSFATRTVNTHSFVREFSYDGSTSRIGNKCNFRDHVQLFESIFNVFHSSCYNFRGVFAIVSTLARKDTKNYLPCFYPHLYFSGGDCDGVNFLFVHARALKKLVCPSFCRVSTASICLSDGGMKDFTVYIICHSGYQFVPNIKLSCTGERRQFFCCRSAASVDLLRRRWGHRCYTFYGICPLSTS